MSNQLSLLNSATLLSWLPDETLFSLMSRHHQRSGSRTAEDTCRMLFGARRAGIQHDFPSGLDEFTTRTHGVYGDATKIVCERTIAPFYFAFRSRAEIETWINHMRGPNVGALKACMGLMVSRFRAHHPLKACLRCLNHDSEQYGEPFWHRFHQLPGVWVCPKHQEWLLEADVKANGVWRFQFVLPNCANLREVMPSETRQAVLSAIAEISEGLVRLPPHESIDLFTIYRSRLSTLSFVTERGRIRLSPLGAKYLSLCNQLRCVPEFANLPTTHEAAMQHIAAVIAEPARKHPLRHVLAIATLFPDWKSFMAERTSSHVVARSDRHALGQTNHPVHSQLSALLADSDRTISEIAQLTNLDPRTVAIRATTLGFPVKPNGDENAIRRALRSGLTQLQVAKICRVTLLDVRLVLAKTPFLRTQQHRSRLMNKRSAWRKGLIDLLRHQPTISRTEVHAIYTAGYAWLIRNDCGWLDAHLPEPLPPARRNPSVDWDARDRQMTLALNETLPAVRMRYSGRRATQWMFFQAIPRLRADYSRIDRLPLTRTTLGSIVGHVL